MNPYDFFASTAATCSDRLALDDGIEQLDYAGTRDLVERFAMAIEYQSGTVQQKVAIFSPNCTRALVSMLAVFRTGSIWIPVNARNALDENILILNRSDVDVLLLHSEHAQHLPRLKAEVGCLRRVICIDRQIQGAESVEEILASLPQNLKARARQPDPSADCAMLSTGGTTGLPKAVVWTESVVEAMVASFWIHLPTCREPIYLAATPLTHAAGVIALCLMARGATVLIHCTAKPDGIMRAISERKVTHLFLPPTAIYTMLDDVRVRDQDYSSLEYFIYTAAPMAPDRIREAMDVFGPVMTQVYGQAEVPLMGTCFRPQEHARFLAQGRLEKFQSCGLPTLLTQVEVMSDTGEILGRGELGEIVFQGALVMRCYYKAPEETAAASAHGWHHTGDIGFKDEDGYLHIVDRKKDMIITGGFNVFSMEVERVIMTYDDVLDCAVVGAPDDKWGEAVTAVIEPKAGRQIDVVALGAYCRQRLGGVKTPKSFLVWTSLPRNSLGKILKREVRDQFWSGRERLI